MQTVFNAVPPQWHPQPPGATGSYDLWQGVRTRRILAFCFDLALIGGAAVAMPLLMALLLGPLGPAASILGFGFSWLLIPPLMPFIAFFYNGVSVSGERMGTFGMRAMGLEIRRVDGGRVSFLTAGVHALLLYLSWTFPVVFLISLALDDKACLHDLLAQVRVMRRYRQY